MILNMIILRGMICMSTDKTIIVNEIEIDEQKAISLLRWLISVEKKNVVSKMKNDTEMIKIIQKKIEEVAKCY